MFQFGFMIAFQIHQSRGQTVKELIVKSDSLSSVDIKKAIYYAKKAIYYAKSSNDTIELIQAYSLIAFIYINMGDQESATINYQKASQLISSIHGDHLELGKIYFHLSRFQFLIANYDSCFVLANLSLENSKLSNFHEAQEYKIKAKNVISKYHFRKGNIELAIKGFNETLNFASEYGYKSNEQQISFNLAQSYMSISDYAKAMKFAQHSMQVSVELKDSLAIAKSQYIKGRVFSAVGDFDESLKILFKAEGYFRALHEIRFLGATMSDIGINYSLLNQPKKSLEYLNKGKKLQELSGDKNSLSHTYALIGKTFNVLDKPDSALFYAYKGYDLAMSINDEISLIENITTLAILNYDTKKYHKAEEFSLRGLCSSEEIGNYKLVKLNSDILFKIYEIRFQPQLALSYLKKSIAAKDSLLALDKIRNIVKTQMTLNHKNEKNRLMANNEKEGLLLIDRLEKQKFLKYVAFGSCFIFMLLVILFYRIYKRKRRDHQLLGEKNKEIEAKNGKLLELSKFKEGLTYMIAHDMKNPLNVIIGLANGSPEESKLKVINQSGKLMLQMITNMLDIQKFEEMKMCLQYDSFNLSKLVIEAKEQVDLNLSAKGMVFKNEVNPEFSIEADYEIMIRVLVNLFTNAIKYSEIGGEIKVVSDIKDERIVLAVIDNGKGIEVEKLPHVFEKFWQTDARKSGKVQSTGLGLTFCKMAIEAHGGEIKVLSTPGIGTRISLDLRKSSVHFSPTLGLEESYQCTIKDLSPKDLLYMKPFVLIMKKLPLYKVSEISNVLDQMEIGSSAVDAWKNQVERAVLNWNIEIYNDLLDSVDEISTNQITTKC